MTAREPLSLTGPERGSKEAPRCVTGVLSYKEYDMGVFSYKWFVM